MLLQSWTRILKSTNTGFAEALKARAVSSLQDHGTPKPTDLGMIYLGNRECRGWQMPLEVANARFPLFSVSFRTAYDYGALQFRRLVVHTCWYSAFVRRGSYIYGAPVVPTSVCIFCCLPGALAMSFRFRYWRDFSGKCTRAQEGAL